MAHATESRPAAGAVDATDWLKAAAILFVTADHVGHFFFESELWWRVFGRLAAPVFFFLLGYATTRRVPLSWIAFGVILTALDSWSANWTWVPPNILLSLALLRFVRPYAENLADAYGWMAIAAGFGLLASVQPVSGQILEYGSVGWMWALLGFCQQRYSTIPVAALPAGDTSGDAQRSLAAFFVALVYMWEQQKEFFFPPLHYATYVAGLAVLVAVLVTFRRKPSAVQPPAAMAGPLRFLGHRTLEIYALQLIVFEFVTKTWPGIVSR